MKKIEATKKISYREAVKLYYDMMSKEGWTRSMSGGWYKDNYYYKPTPEEFRSEVIYYINSLGYELQE